MKINDFILNTDYGSLKNDTQGNTISVTITNGTIYNPSVNNILGTNTITAGTINAGIRARGTSSKSDRWSVGTSLYPTIMVNDLSFPGPYEAVLYCILERISPTQVRLVCATEKTTGTGNFRIEETQTITFIFSTFLSPFD